MEVLCLPPTLLLFVNRKRKEHTNSLSEGHTYAFNIVSAHVAPSRRLCRTIHYLRSQPDTGCLVDFQCLSHRAIYGEPNHSASTVAISLQDIPLPRDLVSRLGEDGAFFRHIPSTIPCANPKRGEQRARGQESLHGNLAGTFNKIPARPSNLKRLLCYMHCETEKNPR